MTFRTVSYTHLASRRDVVPDDIGYVLSTPTVPEFLTGREFLKFFLDIHEGEIENPMPLDAYFDFMSIEPEDRDKLMKTYSHAVSYTHLDVYKRQAQGYVIPENIGRIQLQAHKRGACRPADHGCHQKQKIVYDFHLFCCLLYTSPAA